MTGSEPTTTVDSAATIATLVEALDYLWNNADVEGPLDGGGMKVRDVFNLPADPLPQDIDAILANLSEPAKQHDADIARRAVETERAKWHFLAMEQAETPTGCSLCGQPYVVDYQGHHDDCLLALLADSATAAPTEPAVTE